MEGAKENELTEQDGHKRGQESEFLTVLTDSLIGNFYTGFISFISPKTCSPIVGMRSKTHAVWLRGRGLGFVAS